MASKNLVLKGATWNGVESVDFPVSGGGTARYVETSDADATAADIASGKTAYAGGLLITGSATAPVLTTKSITANGTYNASSDSADGYSSVTVNVSGGGGGDPWSWMGKNPTKLSTVLNEKVYLKNTGLATWTWGTSATTLVASQSLAPTMELDLNDYDYLQVTKFYAHYEYGSWTLASAITDFSYCAARVVSSYWSTYSSAQSEVPSYYDTNGSAYDYRLYYTNSSGTNSITKGGYGIYHDSIESPTLSSTSSTRMTPTATWKVAPLKACGSNSYFSQTAFSNLDMDNSYYEQVVEIWRIDALTNFTSGLRLETVHNLNNGL